eukprot:1023535-Ditylum_brightwellii.AAC.1
MGAALFLTSLMIVLPSTTTTRDDDNGSSSGGGGGGGVSVEKVKEAMKDNPHVHYPTIQFLQHYPLPTTTTTTTLNHSKQIIKEGESIPPISISDYLSFDKDSSNSSKHNLQQPYVYIT